MSKRINTIKELNREQKQRLNVYPRLIQSGKLTRKRANDRYALIRDAIMALEDMTDHEYLMAIERSKEKRKREGGGVQGKLL